MSETYEKQYPSKYGYAVLNVYGIKATGEFVQPRDRCNKKVVFHRVTKNDNTGCNGTWCGDDEKFETVPTHITTTPCKRCFGYKGKEGAY